MQTADAHDDEADAGGDGVFSLTTILDSSVALAAARRLYAQNRAGLRFFCENRRVVSVDDAEAMVGATDEGPEPDSRDASMVGVTA